MEEVVLTQQEFQALSKKAEVYKDYSNKILSRLKDATRNFVEIGFYLNEFKERKLYELEEYKDIYEYSSKTFGLSKTTTSNFIGIYTKFGMCVDLGIYKQFELKKEYQGFNLSKLIELLPVKDEELASYKPDMTIVEIRSIKAQSKIDYTVRSVMDKNNKIFLDYYLNKLNKQLKANIQMNISSEEVHRLNGEGYKIFIASKKEDMFRYNPTPIVNENNYQYNFELNSVFGKLGFEFYLLFNVKEDLSFHVCDDSKWNSMLDDPDINNLDSYGAIDDSISDKCQEIVDILLSDFEVEDKNISTLEKIDYSQYNDHFMSLNDFCNFKCFEQIKRSYSSCKILEDYDESDLKFMVPDVNYSYVNVYVSINGNTYFIGWDGKLEPYDADSDKRKDPISIFIEKYKDLEDEDKLLLKKFIRRAYELYTLD